jgi:hypothetical protein
MAVSLEQARGAKAAAYQAFQKLADVVGVGITRINQDYAVKVNLGQAPDPQTPLPSSVNGVPVRIEVTGRISAR